MTLRRRFADLPWGQLHYRSGGAGGPAPLILLHGAGSNGQGLAVLAEALATTRRVIVPDLPGCGDSDPLPGETVEIADIAAALLGLMDALGFGRCDLHGAHAGARVALDLALRHPDRVRRVILDGVGFYDDAGRQAMLDQVAPAILPDADGAYLHAAYAMCRDYFRFFPWFARGDAHRRDGPPPNPDAVHTKLLEVLKNGATYPAPYHAALRYPLEERLPLLRVPALLAFARSDNVFPQRARAAALLPRAANAETTGAGTPAAAMQTAALFSRFLDTTLEGVEP